MATSQPKNHSEKAEKKPQVLDGEPPTLSNKPQLDRESKLLPLADVLPLSLPLIQVSQAVVFPGMVVPMILSQDRHKNTINFILEHKKDHESAPFVGVSVLKGSNQAGTENGLLPFGVAGRIVKRINLPDGS